MPEEIAATAAFLASGAADMINGADVVVVSPQSVRDSVVRRLREAAREQAVAP